jgi:hypothetical protein
MWIYTSSMYFPRLCMQESRKPLKNNIKTSNLVNTLNMSDVLHQVTCHVTRVANSVTHP